MTLLLTWATIGFIALFVVPVSWIARTQGVWAVLALIAFGPVVWCIFVPVWIVIMREKKEKNGI